MFEVAGSLAAAGPAADQLDLPGGGFTVLTGASGAGK
jgi:hypothetical protein